VSDIDTVVVDSLKALDPEWPIREADVVLTAANGSFVPKAAVSRCSEEQSYSITSSAREQRRWYSRPSAFAVLRLITSSYLVGACRADIALDGVTNARVVKLNGRFAVADRNCVLRGILGTV
jgi:hypothetical protein